MNGNLAEVFNTYNVNILFTVAALPAKVSLGGPGMVMGVPQGGNANLIMGGTPSVEQEHSRKKPVQAS